jgi:hypothetical protein
MNRLPFRSAAILLLLAPIALRAQEPETSEVKQKSASPKPKAPVRGSVTGHVVCGDTRSPARGARVMLLPAAIFNRKGQQSEGNLQPLMSVTGLDGSFFVPHVAPGEYFVAVFAAGYLSPLDGIAATSGEMGADAEKAIGEQLRANAPIANVTGTDSARIDIELQRGAVLSGRVVYADGAPAGQMRVTLQNTDEPKTKTPQGDTLDFGTMLRMMVLQQSPLTDDQGHFRLAGIPPGKYRLAVPQPINSSLQEEMFASFNTALTRAGGLTIYSGDTVHQKAAKVYELHPGDTIDGIEITLPLNGLRAITGIAAGKDGAPLGSGSLDLTDTSDRTIAFHSTVHAGGEFRFSGIPEGTYELKCSNGRIFENQPPDDIGVDNMQFLDQQFKATRAFAESTQAVVVETTDIENLVVTPPDTKLPDPPKTPPNVESIPAPSPQ